ncbi:DNA primase [Solilutibacter silvestris]|uniref:DNA primase n=1 Tax=Solilutibacter silvestris TaxID=1645665 RepID=UPI000CA01DE3|nr:DNA primase [Lysobacter silvestris]
MSFALDVVLSRLDGVQRNRRGHRARCPSCGGRSRKLSISEVDDGKVLLSCHAGCETADVLAAIELQWSDLFPERLAPTTPEQRAEWRRSIRESQWPAAVAALSIEVEVAHVAANAVRLGDTLSDDDMARLNLACSRIARAKAVLIDR